MITASEAAASITSDSLIPPAAAWITLTAISSWGSFAISSWSASSEPETSALSTMLSSLSSPSLRLREDLVEAEPARLAAGELLGLEPVRALLGELAGAAIVLDHLDALAGLADAVEAEHLDRVAGPGVLEAGAGVVLHRAHLAPLGARRRRESPTCSVPRWTSTVTTGPRPGSRCDSITVPEAGASGFAFSSSTSATRRIISSRSSRFSFVFAETLTKTVSPPQSSGLRPWVASSPLTLSGLASGRSILLTATMHRHLGGLRVVDRLDRLRHHPVVGGDDDHDDVGDVGAAGPHRGERRVAGGVDEADRLAVLVHLVGADVLGDPAGLAGDHLGLADRVQQRGLAVVDVAHDRDHRRAVGEVVRIVVVDRRLGDLLGGADHLDLAIERLGEHLDGLVGERLGQGRHLAQRSSAA